MKLDKKKRLAAQILKCSLKRVVFNPERLSEIKEAITRTDIEGLIKDGAIIKMPKRGISRIRARERALQRKKGRQRGYGTRKGKHTARLRKKTRWMNAVRLQRMLLKELRDTKKLAKSDYRKLYLKSKGGFFRSKRHLSMYIEEHNLLKK